MPLDGEKCTMLIKLALNRIRLQKKKRRELNENLKREVATLLVEGKEEQARIRTMTVIHEDYMSQVMTFAEHYLETLALRIDVMAAQVHCPLDVKEQVCGIIYIAPFVEKSTEMIQLREILMKHYGPELASEMLLYKCVDPKVIDRMSRAPPSSLLIDYYLGTIAIAFEIDWEIPSTVIDTDIPTDEISDKDIMGADFEEKVAVKEGVAPKSSENLLVGDAPTRAKKVEGLLKKDSNGHWWVMSQGIPPVFIPSTALNGAREADTVIATLDTRADGKYSGKIFQVKNSQSTPSSTSTSSGGGGIVEGKVKKDVKGNIWVEAPKPGGIPSEKILIYVAQKDSVDANVDDSVVVKLHDRNDGKYSGVILKVMRSAPAPFSSSFLSTTSLQSTILSNNEVIGTLKIDLKGNAWVFEDSSSAPPIFISPQDLLADCHNEDKVRVALHQRTDGKRSGKIVGNMRKNNGGMMSGNFLSELYRTTPTPAMEKEGEIMKDINGHFWLITSSSPTSSSLFSSSSPFTTETLTFVDPNSLNGAENGDHVRAIVSPLPFNPSIFEAKVVSVLQKAETAFVQIVGTLNTKYNVGGTVVGNVDGNLSGKDEVEEGFVVSNDNGQVVYIPPEGLSIPTSLSTPFTTLSSTASILSTPSSTAKSSHGDFVLVSAKRIPIDHPKSKLVKLIGQVIRIIEKGTLDFESELHIINQSDNLPNRKSRNFKEISSNCVGWVQHPTNPFQRILVPWNSLNGGQQGDRVHVVAHQHDGHMIGEVVGIVERKGGAGGARGPVEKKGEEGKDLTEKKQPAYTDEFDELSALWESGLKDTNPVPAKPATIPSTTISSTSSSSSSTTPSTPSKPTDANSFMYENMKFVRVFHPDTKYLLPPVILSFGSSTMRFGLCTDNTPSKFLSSLSSSSIIPVQPSWIECLSSPANFPSHVEPCIVGRPIFSTTTLPSSLSSTLSSRVYVGNDCTARRGILRVHRPLSAGIVTHWDDYEEILRYCFVNVLQIDVSRHPVMIMMGPAVGTTDEDRNKIFSLIFRQFHAPIVAVSSEAIMASRAVKLDTCVVVTMGDSTCSITPIVGNKAVSYAIRQVEIGGEKVTEKLLELLAKDGHGPFESQSEKAAVVNMKEKFSFVGEKDGGKQGGEGGNDEVHYEMKDGRVLTIRRDIFRQCTEVYFTPSLIGADNEAASISTQITTSITLCQAQIQKELWSNIVVCGGASQIPGFHKRLLSELVEKSRVYGEFSPKISFPENESDLSTAGNLTWKGGAQVALGMPEECQWFKQETA